ncbi:MAG: restriction endonuclease subunit S [Chloroflexi bacterium]|nr:restriction endonuclease subunit S [Chloroflexota bacterium]
MMLFGNVDSASLDDPEYFEILGGLWTGKKPPFTKAGVIRNTNFTASGKVDYSDVAWLDVEVKQLAKRQLRHGDIIIERSGGGPKQPVGRVVQFRRSDGVFSFSNFTTTIRVKKPDELDPLFAFYVLLELYQSGRTDDIQRRTTGLRNLDFKAYKERAIFPLISSAEQRRIARVLATVQTAIEQQARLIALTRELKSALMRKLFTEGLRGEKQKETEIGLVPESWNVVKIGSLGKCVTGTTPKTAVKEYYLPAEYDFIAPADLGHTRDIYGSGKKISGKGLSAIRSLPKNAVLCVCIGSSIGKVGMTWKEQSATNQQINAIICNKKHNPKFVYYLLDYFSDYWRGFATFGPVPILNKSRFEGIDVPAPSTLDEQNEIAELLAGLDSKYEFHDKKKTLLEELFRTLLHHLMTGQVRVNGPEFNFIAEGEIP